MTLYFEPLTSLKMAKFWVITPWKKSDAHPWFLLLFA